MGNGVPTFRQDVRRLAVTTAVGFIPVVVGFFGARLRLSLTGRLVWKQIGAQQAEKHQAGAGNSPCSPLRDGTHRYLAQAGYLKAAAESINDFVRVHAAQYRTLNHRRSSNLYLFVFRILNNDHDN